MDRATLILRVALCAALLFGTTAASAAVDPWPAVQIKSSSTGVPIIVGALNRQASVATSGGAAALRASQMLGIGSSAGATLTLSRGVPLSMLASVARIAAVASGPVALAGLALTALNWVDGQWMAPDPDAPMYPGRWYRNLMSHGGCGESPAQCTYAAALAAAVAYHCVWNSANVGCVATGPATLVSGNPNDPSATLVLQVPVQYTWQPGPTVSYGLSQFQAAPVTEGAPVGGDVLASNVQIEQAIADALVAQPSKAGEVLDEAIKNPSAAAYLQADGQTVSGPATVDGGTQQTVHQGAAGTTTTNKTTTYNLTYSPNTVTVTTTVNTTITHPDSSVETIEESSDASEGDAPPAEEVPDVCAENPDASGCAPFGEHEAEIELPDEERSLSWTPEMSSSGACPAAGQFSVAGRSYDLEWTPVCDLASGIRPVVLALAWLSAAVFVFGVGRGAA